MGIGIEWYGEMGIGIEWYTRKREVLDLPSPAPCPLPPAPCPLPPTTYNANRIPLLGTFTEPAVVHQEFCIIRDYLVLGQES